MHIHLLMKAEGVPPGLDILIQEKAEHEKNKQQLIAWLNIGQHLRSEWKAAYTHEE